MPVQGNLYEIMGLPRYAPIDEVRTTFRRLAVQFHPDKNPGNAEAEERFKQIANAYDTLGDEAKKRDYDLRLSGYYTYVKTESPAEKRRKRQEEVQRMRQRMKELEEEEIKQVYQDAKAFMPYKWRYVITVASIIVAMALILHNWFAYDALGKRGTAFFFMFAGYVLSLVATVFFLSSLFKKWNAQNISQPLGFEVRNRITTFFMLYIMLTGFFSYSAPKVYKNAHLALFGKTTTGVVSGEYSPSLLVIYTAEGKKIAKTLHAPRPNSTFKAEVTVTYSLLNPYICEIEYTRVKNL